jgi:membrane fusion protein (multidrug efflux system)
MRRAKIPTKRGLAVQTCKVRIAAGCLAAALAAGCSKEAPPPQRPAPQVTVVTVTPTSIPYISTFVAQTESSRQVDIVARVSGFLDKIAYTEGELVKQGQLLFLLDPKPFQAQLDSARGELKAQEARHATAAANLNRIKPLTQQRALSQADLDKAQGEFDASQAAVFAAGAKVKEQELNLGYVRITAPVTGLASRSLQREGTYVNAMANTAKLTYVAALDPIWVNFSMSQNQVAKLKEMVATKQLTLPQDQHFEVEIILSDGKAYPHKGKVSFADPSFSQETGSFLVRAVLPNPTKELRPGMFVTANVRGGTRENAVVVPQLSVQQGSNGHLVYVVKQDGTAELRPVVVGDYQGSKDIVIVSGLQAGDRVVAEGALKVVPGQPVKIVEPGADKKGGGDTKAAKK